MIFRMIELEQQVNNSRQNYSRHEMKLEGMAFYFYEMVIFKVCVCEGNFELKIDTLGKYLTKFLEVKLKLLVNSKR